MARRTIFLRQHVTAPFIRRHHSVVDQKRGGARVVGVDAQDSVGARIVPVNLAEQLARTIDDGTNQIRVRNSK